MTNKHIENLLESYYEIKSDADLGCWRALDELMTLDKAVSEAQLTLKEWEVVEYAVKRGVPILEYAKSIGMSNQLLFSRKDRAIEKIAAVYERWGEE